MNTAGFPQPKKSYFTGYFPNLLFYFSRQSTHIQDLSIINQDKLEKA